jgi:hypothetical protein
VTTVTVDVDVSIPLYAVFLALSFAVGLLVSFAASGWSGPLSGYRPSMLSRPEKAVKLAIWILHHVLIAWGWPVFLLLLLATSVDDRL